MTTSAINQRPTIDVRAPVWLAAALVASFAISAVFSGVLRLPREWFLIPWVAGGGAIFAAFVHAFRIDVRALMREHLVAGLVAAAIASAFLVVNVNGQPAGAVPQGFGLVGQAVWFGVAYGAIDGLLLSVLPVLAVDRWLPGGEGRRSRRSMLRFGAVALVASCLMAAIYHLGYVEFRSARLVTAIIGNGVMTLAYLISRNPLAPVLSHAVMHVAAVLHGAEATVQLPPHY